MNDIVLLSSSVAANADSYRQQFTGAVPFRHICIDDFFDTGFATRLLAEFPSFDPKLSINEIGKMGGKSVNTKIREISPAYEELYAFISGRPFLDFMSRLSGIPDLLLDPKMFGGGTHENRHGQDLDPHVDFNYTEDHNLHRRLNLIVYLNEGWQTEWGGAIEIHSNPREPDTNQIRVFDPIFNRAVMFETNEISWHGFPRIELPEGERHRSRKSISIYLYTKERPPGEIAPLHGTFYVQRPLPTKIQPGHTLTAEDVTELRSMIVRRDRWIELYQKMELDRNATIAALGAVARQLKESIRLPLSGYLAQEGPVIGAQGDGWIMSLMSVRLRPGEPLESLTLIVYRPPEATAGRVRMVVDGTEVAAAPISTGRSEVTADIPRAKDESFQLEIFFAADQPWSPAGDKRDLALMLVELRAGHATGKPRGRFSW